MDDWSASATAAAVPPTPAPYCPESVTLTLTRPAPSWMTPKVVPRGAFSNRMEGAGLEPEPVVGRPERLSVVYPTLGFQPSAASEARAGERTRLRQMRSRRVEAPQIEGYASHGV